MGKKIGTHNYRLVLKYDGTHFKGMQSQPDTRTVQQVLEDALHSIFGIRFTLYSSGRTDAGVHAQGQVVNFFMDEEIDPQELLGKLNSILPDDVSVLEAGEAPLDFHSRYSAVSKTYIYTILRQRKPRTGYRTDVYYWGGPLDVDKMRRAAACLIGTSDFSSFGCNPRYNVKEKVKTIIKLDIAENGDYIRIAIKGSGFLYKMVRSIVGTLLWVGTGKIPPNKMQDILEACDRTKAGPAAAASGLCLMGVDYPE